MWQKAISAVNGGGGDLTFTEITGGLGNISISESHKAVMLTTYRSGSSASVTYNGTSVTALDSFTVSSAYIQTFIIKNVKSGDTITSSFGDGFGYYID